MIVSFRSSTEAVDAGAVHAGFRGLSLLLAGFCRQRDRPTDSGAAEDAFWMLCEIMMVFSVFILMPANGHDSLR